MSWVVVALGAVAVGTAAYSADAQRKGVHEQQDALNVAQADDARQKVEAETSAALAANTKLAADKRARQANVLALGGAGGTLGAPPASSASVLGGGAPVVSAGRAVPTPRGNVGAF